MVPIAGVSAQDVGDGQVGGASAVRERLMDEAFRLLPADLGLKQIVLRAGLLWPNPSVSVCFADGDAGLQRRVIAAAEQWNALGSPVKLDFGDAPRACSAFPNAELHVGFSSPVAGGHHATVGTSRINPKPNIMFSRLQAASDDKLAYFVRHEFGHALGLQHEIRHPQANCAAQINKEELYKYYATTYGSTDRTAIDAEIRTYLPEQVSGTVTPPDMASIMMYRFPAEVFNLGEAASCYAPPNSSITPGDIAALKLAYAKRALALSTIASRSTALPPEQRGVVNALLAYELSSAAARRAADVALADEAASSSAAALSKGVFAVTQQFDR